MAVWWKGRPAAEGSPSVGSATPDEPTLRQRIAQAAGSVSGAVVVGADVDGRICYFNPAAERLTGYTEPEVVGRSLVDLLVPVEQAGATRAAFGLLAAGKVPVRYEIDWLTREGVCIPLAFVTTALRDTSGRIAHVVGAGIDLREHRRGQHLMEAVLAATTEQALIACDRQGRITLFNAGAERMLGHTAEQALGRDMALLLHDPAELREQADALGVSAESVVVLPAQAGGRGTRPWTYRRRDGSTLTVALSVTPLSHTMGELEGYLAVAVDITDQQDRERQLRDEAEQAVHRAAHDPLTGLPNRTVLMDRLDRALTAQRRHQRLSGLLYLDVDRLKAVNDAHGHAAGDALLVEVGRRLAAASREGDLCARLGGDEFAVLLEDLRDAAELETVSDRIQQHLAEPLQLATGALSSAAASTGSTLTRTTDTAPDTVLARADRAMYLLKTTRRGAYPNETQDHHGDSST